MLENALDAIVAIDADGAVTAWNPQAEAMFGWAADEVLGRQLSDRIIPEQHREAHQRGLERYLKTGEGTLLNKRVEMTALRRNGCEFPIELAISPSEGRDGITFSAFIRDITERRQTEGALRESEEKYRDLVENSSEIIYTLDPSSNITYISPAVSQLGGYEAEELIGKSSLSFVHPDDMAELLESFKRTITGQHEPSEYRLRMKDGGYLWVRDLQPGDIRRGQDRGPPGPHRRHRREKEGRGSAPDVRGALSQSGGHGPESYTRSMLPLCSPR